MRDDRKVNKRKVLVYSRENGKVVEKTWNSLRLGDIVKIN